MRRRREVGGAQRRKQVLKVRWGGRDSWQLRGGVGGGGGDEEGAWSGEEGSTVTFKPIIYEGDKKSPLKSHIIPHLVGL